MSDIPDCTEEHYFVGGQMNKFKFTVVTRKWGNPRVALYEWDANDNEWSYGKWLDHDELKMMAGVIEMLIVKTQPKG